MIPIRKIDTAIALRTMAMENSLLQSYRALFIGIEAALLASAFALSRLDMAMAEKVWMVGAAGLAFCAFWIIVCAAKGKDVDKWMKYLTEEAKEKEFFSYMKAGLTFQGGRFARHWFNEAMPSLIIALWIWMIISPS